jgi:hypothetical protein
MGNYAILCLASLVPAALAGVLARMGYWKAGAALTALLSVAAAVALVRSQSGGGYSGLGPLVTGVILSVAALGALLGTVTGRGWR